MPAVTASTVDGFVEPARRFGRGAVSLRPGVAVARTRAFGHPVGLG